MMVGQLNSNVPYEAEPIDVWGIGVILFTLLTGSAYSLLSLSYSVLILPHIQPFPLSASFFLCSFVPTPRGMEPRYTMG